MSIQYEIIETLSVKNTETCPSIVSKMYHQLSRIGMQMLQDDVSYCNLQLDADGKKYTFCGTAPTPEYKVLLRMITEATAVDLHASYSYTQRASIESSNLADLAQQIMRAEETEEGAKDFFYMVYITADCVEGMGNLYAYGTKDGKTYCGIVEAKAADDAALAGKWFSNADAIAVTFTACREGREVIRLFDEIKADYEYGEADPAEAEFYLNEITLNSKADIEKFLIAVEKLVTLPDAKASFISSGTDDCLFELVDVSGTYPRMLKVYAEDGKMFCKIAEV